LDRANLTHRFYDSLLSFPQPLSFFPPQFLQHRPPLIVLRYRGGREEGRKRESGKEREEKGGNRRGRWKRREMVSRESGGEREGVSS
jgi:hypothetical protein